jgi:hypothetical protein
MCKVQLTPLVETEQPCGETPRNYGQQLTLGGITKAKDTVTENQEWQRRYATLAS